VVRDLTHLLLPPDAGRNSGCGGHSAADRPDDPDGGYIPEPPAADEASASGYWWNLFAYPVEVNSTRYAFLTDARSVVAVDDETFRDLQGAQGRPLPPALVGEQAERLRAAGLVRTQPPSRQFNRVFGAKAAAAKENELLHLITSYTCNLTCSYCFMLADLDDHRERFLSFDDARRGIDAYFAKPHRLDSVIHFYGGEPLLHPQLIDDCLTYINRCYSDQVLPKIITNGTLHSDVVLELLARYPFDLSVSMDGDRDAHDVFRLDHQGRSTFDKTVQGIEAFRQIGYEPKVLITVGAHNIGRLPEVVSAVLDLGPHAIALNFPRELPQSDTGLDSVVADPAFWVAQYRRCVELCYARHVPELYFADMLFAFLSGEPVLSPCAACGSQLSVGPGGQVGPCQAFVAAGMFSHPIDEHGATDGPDPFRPWAQVSKATSRKCSRCPIAPICGGDCSFDRYNRTGSLFEPLELHCDLRLRMADELARRLVAGEQLGFAAVP
jgi:radical SAM protein with 4Fe4S-binding SPASM domain